jgi:hypothetical protein
MDERDIMIGSLVKFGDKKGYVDSIFRNDDKQYIIGLQIFENEYIEAPLDSVEPVMLTDENALRLGFEKPKHPKLKLRYISAPGYIMTIDAPEEDNSWLLFIDATAGDTARRQFIGRIRSVNELQRAMRDCKVKGELPLSNIVNVK